MLTITVTIRKPTKAPVTITIAKAYTAKSVEAEATAGNALFGLIFALARKVADDLHGRVTIIQ